MVSVCMATYNGEKYIHRQLVSILNQIDFDDEVIISDDSSTDNTLSIVKQFDDHRIQVFTNQGVSGPVGNFESALFRASGDYIILADQDDFWLPKKVDLVKSLLQDNDLLLSDC